MTLNKILEAIEALGILRDISDLKKKSSKRVDLIHSGASVQLLRHLSDVTLTDLSNNEVLTYDATLKKWTNKPAQGGGGGAVDSVNGKVGVVVLDPDDLDDTLTTNKFTTTADIAKLAGIEPGADVTDSANVGSSIHGTSAKTTPVDADTFGIIDSEDSNLLKKVSWLNIKATQKTYFDTIYANVVHTHTASQITDFDTEVSNNADVSANTSARHSALTVTDSAEIDFTLTGQDLTASIIAGSIDETKLDASTNASLNLADSSVQPADIANFETTTQLNTRDTNNRARANHTGTQTASTISDFQTTVSSNTDVSANTTARHTHANKALLDTYTQTEVDLADAVSKKHVAATAGTGISIAGQVVTNTDLGSSAVTTHESTYDHTLLHSPVTVADTATIDLSLSGQQVSGIVIDDSITNSKLANMAANTIKGRITASTGDPEDLSATNVRTIINVENGADVTDLTNVSSSVNGATTETSVADGDFFAFLDITASNVFKKITWTNIKAAITALYVTLTTSQTITGQKTFVGASTPATAAIFQGSASHTAYFHPVAAFYNSAGAQKGFLNALGGGYWSNSHYILPDQDVYHLFMRNNSTQNTFPIILQNSAGSQNIFVVSPTGKITCQGAYLGYAPTVSDLAAVTEGMLIPRNADMGNQIFQDYQDEFAYVDKFADSITISTAPLATVSDSGFTVNEVMFRDNADYNVWTADPSPLVIEIDMTTNPIPVRSNATWQLGMTTRSGGVGVDNIKVEIWDGSAYQTVYDAAPGIHALNITGFGFFCTPQFISFAANGYVISKLKLTVDVDAATVSNGFRIQRIMLYHPTQTWDPWKLSKGGDTIYGDLNVPDDAYASTWNGDLSVPTKNAVYDIIQARATVIPFITDDGVLTLTNQASAEQFLGNTNRLITKFDLTGYSQVRLLSRVSVGSASANTPRLIAKYHTSFTTTVGTFSDIGTSAVSTSLTTTGLIDSGWIDLAAGAKADVFLTVTQIGGDGAADPALGLVSMHFR